MHIIRKETLDSIVVKLIGAGYDVFGPVKRYDTSLYGRISSAKEVDFDLILPTIPLKSLFFPPTERIFEYRRDGVDIEIKDFLEHEDLRKKAFIFTRPCDAASLDILDPLFSWDSIDPFWERKRRSSVIAAISCTQKDEFCMCTSLGFGPSSRRGADLIFYPLSSVDDRPISGWAVDVLTDKGREALSVALDLIEVVDSERSVKYAELASVEEDFSLKKVIEWLSEAENFSSPFWKEISLRCVSCGVCTYLCPTCHCFDIQDEADIKGGVRYKNWDSCAFSCFTQHASGYNPRPVKSARWRQRIMHKFYYYKELFDKVACSGCGRCVRYCPVSMGIKETLQEISCL